jgi:dual specificity MAP kinase phosphatase
MIPSDNKKEPTGLHYPPGFLSSLPILLSRPEPFAPIRALTAAQFAEIHRLHALADDDQLGDSVLFPFLHGLEGNNVSQNAFFANAGRAVVPMYSHPLLPPVNPTVKVPGFRGLIWVRADEHDGIVANGNGYLSQELGGGDRDSDDFDMADSDNEDFSDSSAGDHSMREIHGDARSPVAIDIPGRTSRSPSTASTSNSSSEPAVSPSTAATSLPASPSSLQCPSMPFTRSEACMLASSFKVQDLLVTCPDGFCFAPPRVPDGISL